MNDIAVGVRKHCGKLLIVLAMLLSLPSYPGREMSAVISHRLTRIAAEPPEPMQIEQLEIQRAALNAFDYLLRTYCGADFDRSVLIEQSELVLNLTSGGEIRVSAVIVWDNGVFAAFHRAEIPLDDEYWIERALFQNELNHNGEALEE